MEPKDKQAAPPVKKAAPKKKAAAKPAAEKKPTHKITVKRDGFRRCGREWIGETEIFAGELKPKEIKTLEADPMFVVVAL